jgi:hypothetical protein
MPTEAGRHQLYEKIATEWGQEYAEELMSYLPPVGWADVATKQDLKLLSAELRADLGREIANVRTELGDRITDVSDRITDVSDKLAGVSDKIVEVQRTMISLMVLLSGIIATIATVVALATR